VSGEASSEGEGNKPLTASAATPSPAESAPSEGLGDKFLRCYEMAVITGILLFMALAAVVCIIWICSGKFVAIHARIFRTIRILDQHWKFGLLILILLIFRPLRQFLMNLTEGPFGTKAAPSVRQSSTPAQKSNKYGAKE
jgi:hypothetical protein